ncbi:MAG TPA: hypothetical protein VEK56_11375 [Vicinamibacterales bacterium]|nr:hypothetical protein [Vicinamibacterales bacterium]
MMTDSASPLVAKPSRRLSRRTSPRSATELLECAQYFEIARAKVRSVTLSQATVEFRAACTLERVDQKRASQLGLSTTIPCRHITKPLADTLWDIQIDAFHDIRHEDILQDSFRNLKQDAL